MYTVSLCFSVFYHTQSETKTYRGFISSLVSSLPTWCRDVPMSSSQVAPIGQQNAGRWQRSLGKWCQNEDLTWLYYSKGIGMFYMGIIYYSIYNWGLLGLDFTLLFYFTIIYMMIDDSKVGLFEFIWLICLSWSMPDLWTNTHNWRAPHYGGNMGKLTEHKGTIWPYVIHVASER